MVAGGCQVGWGVTTNGSGLSCWGGDNVLDLVVMVAQLCDYIKNH